MANLGADDTESCKAALLQHCGSCHPFYYIYEDVSLFSGGRREPTRRNFSKRLCSSVCKTLKLIESNGFEPLEVAKWQGLLDAWWVMISRPPDRFGQLVANRDVRNGKGYESHYECKSKIEGSPVTRGSAPAGSESVPPGVHFLFLPSFPWDWTLVWPGDRNGPTATFLMYT